MTGLAHAKQMLMEYEDALAMSDPSDDRASIKASIRFWRSEVQRLEAA